MRHDVRNTGAGDVRPRVDRRARPWAFHTARGVFSTPVLDDAGDVYVGSADRSFVALSPTGRLRWRIRTGGLIDAAAVLGPGPVVHLRRGRRGPAPRRDGPAAVGAVARRADAPGRPRAARALVGGQPAARARTARRTSATRAAAPTRSTPTGTCAGRTSAGTRCGPRRRSAPTGRPTGARWTWRRSRSTATGANAGAPRGRLRRRVAGARRGRPHALHASFDGSVSALDAATGAVRWRFRTPMHLYASPALREDAAGRVTGVAIASTDGTIRMLGPGGQRALALRHRRARALVARARARPGGARALAAARRLRRLGRRAALRPRRRHGPAALVLRHDAAPAARAASATTSTPPRRSAGRASSSPASTATWSASPTTGAFGTGAPRAATCGPASRCRATRAGSWA